MPDSFALVSLALIESKISAKSNIPKSLSNCSRTMLAYLQEKRELENLESAFSRENADNAEAAVQAQSVKAPHKSPTTIAKTDSEIPTQKLQTTQNITAMASAR